MRLRNWLSDDAQAPQLTFYRRPVLLGRSWLACKLFLAAAIWDGTQGIPISRRGFDLDQAFDSQLLSLYCSNVFDMRKLEYESSHCRHVHVHSNFLLLHD